MTKAPWHSRFALILALLLPLYFALAALGTKFGLWGWRTGLLTLTIQTGPILMGVVALAALISLIVVLLRKPRKGWLLSLIALLIPVGIFAGLGHIRSQAADIPPIHDIATDTTVPPTFSQRVLDLRSETKANPLNDYSVPIGEFAMWADSPAPLAEQSHAQIIAASYPDLAPLPALPREPDNRLQIRPDRRAGELDILPFTRRHDGRHRTADADNRRCDVRLEHRRERNTEPGALHSRCLGQSSRRQDRAQQHDQPWPTMGGTGLVHSGHRHPLGRHDSEEVSHSRCRRAKP